MHGTIFIFLYYVKESALKSFDNDDVFVEFINHISEDYIVKDRKMNIGCSVGGAFFPLQGMIQWK
ncbi:hypothetical protein [Clostridium beijerinckii]|uniref:hypothetical protein n=1 Tax=Clostridium beijerinckii TaxID=1520 RepID=UPI00047A4C6B|nr:hypothetical protein [Clostridium beijerinckii]